MSTKDEGEIAQSDRGQLRALAQKRRAAKAERREVMFELVVAGYERELIAQKLGVSLAAARWEVDNAVDHCRLDAPDRYVRLQVTRLTKALRVVDGALALCALKATEPPVKALGMLDRYHGLAAAGATNGRAVEPRRLSRAVAPLALTHAAPGLELSRVEVQKVAEGKFSWLQPIELSQNREIISIRRHHEDASRWKPTMTEGPSPKGLSSRLIVVRLNRGVSVAGIAAREVHGKSRREMAPQWLEKIESAPGNGMASEAANPQDVVHGREADRAPLALTSRKNDKAAKGQKKAPSALISFDAGLKSPKTRNLRAGVNGSGSSPIADPSKVGRDRGSLWAPSRARAPALRARSAAL